MYLSPIAANDLLGGQQHERSELVPCPHEHHVVEVGERDDQPDVVLRDELAQAAT